MGSRTTLIVTAVLLGSAFLAVAHAQPPAAKEGANKCALLVGINTYGSNHTPSVWPQSSQWSELKGSHNDVAALKGVLEKRYGFQVHTLLDAAATAKGIREAFETHLIQCVRDENDVAFFHYSGHGQQIPDQNGDEQDGYDESLVPYDNLGLLKPENNLRDDDFEAWLEQLGKRTPNVIISMDSCHSGSATRSAATPRGSSIKLPPAETRRMEAPDSAPGGWVAQEADKLAYVFLAAANSNEKAYETRVRTCSDGAKRCAMGRFTQALVQKLWDASPRLTYGELIDQVRSQMRRSDQVQNPQIVGARKRRLFSSSQRADAVRSHVVPPVERDQPVVIEAGLLHGLEVGAVFTIHRSEADFANKTPPLAMVRIEEISGSRSYGKPFHVLDPAAFTETGRAVQTYSDMQGLLVQTEVTVKGLKRALDGQRHIELKARNPDSSTSWQVRVFKDGDEIRLETNDGAPVGFPTRDENAAMMDESVPWKGEDTAQRVAGALQSYFKRNRLLSLDNRLATRALDVTLRLERQEAGTGPLVPIESGSIGNFSVDRGDVVRVVVDNCHPKPVYVSLLEIGPTGLINHVFPPPGGDDNLIDAGRPRIGDLQPAQCTSKAIITSPLGPPYGDYTFKLVATQSKLDLSSLQFTVSDTGEVTEPAKTRSVCGSDLECLFTTVGPRTRSAKPRNAADMQWATSTLNYVIEQ